MSTEALDYVLNHSPAEGSARLILMVLAHVAEKSGAGEITSAQLVERAQISPKQAAGAIKSLLTRGEVKFVNSTIQEGFTYRIVGMPVTDEVVLPEPERKPIEGVVTSEDVVSVVSAAGLKADAIAPLHWYRLEHRADLSKYLREKGTTVRDVCAALQDAEPSFDRNPNRLDQILSQIQEQ